ncbi:MAG: TRAP transporter substrate-binding protein [Alphaproteobacteria bacterium]|nr:MAG: TRAP transporter substrate-binding protein [Alphaproteobacteria bacterium]
MINRWRKSMFKQQISRQRSTLLAVCLGLAALGSGLLAGGASARELKFSLYVSEIHPSVKLAYKPFADELKEKSGGKLTVKFYYNKILGGTAQQLKIVENGVADISNIVPIYTKGRFPLLTVSELPVMFDSSIEATDTMNAVKDKYFASEFNTVKLLDFVITAPSVVLTTKKPLAKLEDLQNMNIRASAGANVLTKFGANLVAMPVTDTYLAMERGAVDGTVIPFGSMFSYKFEEVAKYVNPLNLYSVATAFIMNKDTWASLSPEEQKIMAEASAHLAYNAAKAQDDSTEAARGKVAKLGIKIVKFSDADMKKLKETAKPEWDLWVENHSKDGAPGAELLQSVIAARDAERTKTN